MNIGEVVEGRYRIVKLLGQGGMGAVFLAQDEVLDKPVAVKTLLPQALSDARSVEQLKKEFRLSQELRHENICASYHFQVSGTEPFQTTVAAKRFSARSPTRYWPGSSMRIAVGSSTAT